MTKVSYREVEEYKEIKTSAFRRGIYKAQTFVSWLKKRGYSDIVELELDKEDIHKCMRDYFIVLNSNDEVSALDRLSSGYSVRRNDVTLGVRALYEDEDVNANQIVPYSREYGRVIEPDNLESLLLKIS